MESLITVAKEDCDCIKISSQYIWPNSLQNRTFSLCFVQILISLQSNHLILKHGSDLLKIANKTYLQDIRKISSKGGSLILLLLHVDDVETAFQG
jgi:hypothetical protein